MGSVSAVKASPLLGRRRWRRLSCLRFESDEVLYSIDQTDVVVLAAENSGEMVVQVV